MNQQATQLPPVEERPILKLGTGCSLTEWSEIQNWVYFLKTQLARLGYYSGQPDGCFEEGTEQAVKDFQKASGLSAHGFVEEETWATLDATFAEIPEEPMLHSYGERQSNGWEAIVVDKEILEGTFIEAGVVYEAIYSIQKKAWYEFWAFWIREFDPVQFTDRLREKLAEATGATKEEINIPWWSYDNESDPAVYSMQFRYIPPAESPGAVAALPWIPLMVLGGMILIGYLATIFHLTSEPKLEQLKKMVEEVVEVIPKILKYAIYITLIGGGFWLLAKVLPKSKKEPKS